MLYHTIKDDLEEAPRGHRLGPGGEGSKHESAFALAAMPRHAHIASYIYIYIYPEVPPILF